MMKNSKQLIFYPVYCTRCFQYLILKSLKDPCIICGKTDKIVHSIKEKNRITNSERINKKFIWSLFSLQKSIDSLRIIMKYMQFDLEATRRENKSLKKKLTKYEGESQSEE